MSDDFVVKDRDALEQEVKSVIAVCEEARTNLTTFLASAKEVEEATGKGLKGVVAAFERMKQSLDSQKELEDSLVTVTRVILDGVNEDINSDIDLGGDE